MVPLFPIRMFLLRLWEVYLAVLDLQDDHEDSYAYLAFHDQSNRYASQAFHFCRTQAFVGKAPFSRLLFLSGYEDVQNQAPSCHAYPLATAAAFRPLL